jgi:hypothetical protein
MNISFKIKIISDHSKASWTKESWARPSLKSADAMPIHTVDFSGHPESPLHCVFRVDKYQSPIDGWCGIMFKSGHYYEGFTRHGSPSGKGTIFDPSGDFIEGSWTKGAWTPFQPSRPHTFLVGSLVQVSRFSQLLQGTYTSQCSFSCSKLSPFVQKYPCCSSFSLHRHGQAQDPSIVL